MKQHHEVGSGQLGLGEIGSEGVGLSDSHGTVQDGRNDPGEESQTLFNNDFSCLTLLDKARRTRDNDLHL